MTAPIAKSQSSVRSERCFWVISALLPRLAGEGRVGSPQFPVLPRLAEEGRVGLRNFRSSPALRGRVGWGLRDFRSSPALGGRVGGGVDEHVHFDRRTRHTAMPTARSVTGKMSMLK